MNEHRFKMTVEDDNGAEIELDVGYRWTIGRREKLTDPAEDGGPYDIEAMYNGVDYYGGDLSDEIELACCDDMLAREEARADHLYEQIRERRYGL